MWILIILFSILIFVSSHITLDSPRQQRSNIINKTSRRRPLGYKIFNLGLPKSGSSSLHSYFHCHNLISFHWSANGVYVGPCMDAFKKNVTLPKLIQRCSIFKHFDAYTQMDYIEMHRCLFPQNMFLEWIDQTYPKSKFIMLTRPVHDWIKSINHWKNDMGVRLLKCIRTKYSDITTPNASRYDVFKSFYEWHYQYVINYFKERSDDLIILSLYNVSIDQSLSSALRLPSKGCFPHANANKALNKRGPFNESTSNTSVENS